MFSSDKSVKNFDDFLVTFNKRGEETSKPKSSEPRQQEIDFDKPDLSKKGGIEVGEDELDEKWQLVNQMAKARWGTFLKTVEGVEMQGAI